MIKIQYFILFAGIWSLGNGILHDIFVLMKHKTYDRDLMRLLIDGHILIFSGILYFLCYNGIVNNELNSIYFAIAISIFLLGYCAIIFKMLPSVGTIAINLAAFIWLIIKSLNING